MTIEPRKPSEVPEKMGGAGLGVFFGWLLESAGVGPVGVVGPMLTPLFEGWAASIRREFGARGHEVAAGVVGASGLSEAETAERLLSSDQLQPLVKRVLDAAARTNSIPKLRLLGAVLGQAVSDRPRKIEDDFLIVAALDDLEAPHVRILEALERPVRPSDEAARWTAAELAATVTDVSGLTFYGALGGLVRHGLVDTLSLWGAIGYDITDLGRAVLEVTRLDL